jgi:hypothetical protein
MTQPSSSYPFVIPTVSGSTSFTFTYISVETKEQKKERLKREKRAASAKRWFERARARNEAWFAAEMIKVEAEAKANEWRPKVSHRNYNCYDLAWHSLGKAGADEHENWRRERIRYINKWCGITISHLSHFEQQEINAFISTIRKRDVYNTGNEPFTDYDGVVGGHKVISTGYWFRNLEDHNRFVKMLEAIPQRKEGLLISDSELTKATISKIKRNLSGCNYMLTRGQIESVLTFATKDSEKINGIFGRILGVREIIH